MCALRSEPSVHIIRVVSAQIIHFSGASSNDFQMEARDFHMRLGTSSECKTPSTPESQWHFGIGIGIGVNDLKIAGPSGGEGEMPALT